MSICNRTPTSTEEARQFIAERMAYFTGQIQVLPGLPETPPPVKRSDWIDPETRLQRKKPLSRNQTEALAALAERKKLPEDQRPPTLQQIAEQHGIGKSTLARRLRMGMSMTDAVRPTNPNLGRSRRINTLPDSEVSINELARRYGIAWSTLRRRIDRWMTLEQALSTPTWERAKL